MLSPTHSQLLLLFIYKYFFKYFFTASFSSVLLVIFSFADADLVESPYNHIYGRLPLPTRGYVPTPRTMYIGEWD